MIEASLTNLAGVVVAQLSGERRHTDALAGEVVAVVRHAHAAILTEVAQQNARVEVDRDVDDRY